MATALHEMAQAAGAALGIDVEAVPVFAETRAVCDALALDPMGLLASAAMLAIVSADASARVREALANVKIACTAIGTVVSGPPRVILGGEDSAVPLPRFERDELARFYDAQGEVRGMKSGAGGI